jgi:hypothetical protein
LNRRGALFRVVKLDLRIKPEVIYSFNLHFPVFEWINLLVGNTGSDLIPNRGNFNPVNTVLILRIEPFFRVTLQNPLSWSEPGPIQ